MHIETERLLICNLSSDMARDIHLNSLDEDTRRFVPDEVFETVEDTADTIAFLIRCYETGNGPLVYPILLRDGTNIGYVQAVPVETEWEIGYHIAKAHTGLGYASEAVRAFLPVILVQLGIPSILGVCLADNSASIKVLEHTGFRREYEGAAYYQGMERKICRYRYERPKEDRP